MGLPTRDYFLKGRGNPVIVAYRNFLQQSAVLFGADPNIAAEDAQHVVDMETELANVCNFQHSINHLNDVRII